MSADEFQTSADSDGNRSNAWYLRPGMKISDGPVAIVFTLRTFENRTIPPPYETGQAARHLFFSLLTKTDPDLANSLHGACQIKPYTTSLLMTSRHEPGLIRWRVTDLTGALIPLLHRAAFPRSGPSMEDLCQVPARFESMAVSESHDSGAGSVSWARLAEAPSKDRFFVHFCSPCIFRTGGRYTNLFPNPISLLNTASSKWDVYSGQPPFGEDLIRQLASHISVHWTKLDTVKVLGMGGIRQPAAIGEVIYRLEDDPKRPRLSADHRRAFAVLFPFMRWSGVGWSTGAGLGQVRVEDAR